MEAGIYDSEGGGGLVEAGIKRWGGEVEAGIGRGGG